MNPEKSTLDELRIDRSAPARKNSLIVIVVLAAILIGLASGVGWWIKRPNSAQVRTFAVLESTSGGNKTLLNSSGYVTARREATVSSKVTGKVVEVLIEEGMKVSEGQVLARLDSSNVQASLQLAQAQWEAAKSALEETKVRVNEAEKESKRITGLAKDRIASESELDRAEAELKSRKAQLDRQIVEVAVADRQVALWRQQMEDTIILAPFAGIVTSKNAQQGEMISPMAVGGFTRTGICTIVDMESLEIEIDVNESYINRVEADQRVVATLDAYPDWKVPAKVIAIIPTADRQKATVKVRVGFDNLDPRILPQMGVKVAFQSTGEAPAASGNIAVPKAAVRQRDGRDVVWLFRDGRVERRAVTVGAARGDEVTIAAGLSSGDKVVVEGPDNLADGARVTEANR
jgi:RND family efflux transporter MFP subunit